MDIVKRRLLLNEVYGLMDKSKLSMLLRDPRKMSRMGAFQGVLRDAMMESSLCSFNGAPYYFGGRIYESMSWDDLGNLVYELMDRCCLPSEDMFSVMNMVRTVRMAVMGKTLRIDNALVVLGNCVLDLNTLETRPFGKGLCQVTAVDYDYDKDAVAVRWLSFLEQVLPNDRVRRVLQEFLGSIFIERSVAKMENMLILKGSGSNGKSVIFETVMGILGRQNVSNFGLSSLMGGNDRKKNVAFINGKRLNYCSEIQASEFGRHSDVLKTLISGEPTEARALYGENFTAYNIPLMMANTNNMPYLGDLSWGMRRRITVIPFMVQIDKRMQDKSLSRKLEEEYPGILNWILEGRRQFVANGYKLSDSEEMEAFMEEYQATSNSVTRFMYVKNYKSTLVRMDDIEPRWLKASSLYRDYLRWCDDNRLGHESAIEFSRILSDCGYMRKRDKDGVMYGIYGRPLEAMAESARRRKSAMRDADVHDVAAEKEAVLELVRPDTYNTFGAAGVAKGYRARIQEMIVRDGRRYAYTIEGLAYHLHINLTTVTRWVKDGLLEGCYELDGRVHTFDFAETCAKLEKLGLIGVADAEKAEMRRRAEDLKYMRSRFNERMKLSNLPFRKYETKKGKKGIVVPDDWEFTEENAEEMLRKKGLMSD